MLKKHPYYYICIFICLSNIFLFTSCDNKETANLLFDMEYLCNEQLSSLSSDNKGYWIGSETGIIYHIEKQNNKKYNTGLDRIYDIARDNQDSSKLWIASRNAGIQLYKIENNTLVHKKTYTIKNKGNRYSPYDIEISDSNIFAATSQGLYKIDLKNHDNSQMIPIYPINKHNIKNKGMPFPITQLCISKGKYLFAATHEGLIFYNLQNKKIYFRHKGHNINYLSINNGKLYILLDRQMIIETLEGKLIKEISLPNTALAFYKIGKVYYFISPSSIHLSDDLKRFVSIPLYYNIPNTSHNFILPNNGNGFSLMITNNAVWRIPHHLGVLNSNTPILSAFYNGKDFYYVNDYNELFFQKAGTGAAYKIYEFPQDNNITSFCAIGNTIYYCNNNNLYYVNIADSYLYNYLLVHPRLLYHTNTHITSMTVLPKNKKILLGIQDFLLSIDSKTCKIDTVKQLNNKYITSISHVLYSEDLYISTLNDGIFCLSGGKVFPVKGTGKYPFIHDLLVNNSYERNVLFLTNHKLLYLGIDSIEVNGNKRLFSINDSIIYTIPEAGIHKYIIKNKKIKDCGLLYADIRFNPLACFVSKKKLYLGSNIGMAILSPYQENKLEWISFDNKVNSLLLFLIIIPALIFIILVYLLSIYKYHSLQKKQLQIRINDLQQRSKSLNTMLAYLEQNGKDAITDINNSIKLIKTNRKNITKTNEQIKHISERIMHINRDAALQMIKVIDRQIEQIRNTDFQEQKQLINDSEKAKNSNNIDLIIYQSNRNEKWLCNVHNLVEHVQMLRISSEGILTLHGINENMSTMLDKIEENSHRKPLSEIYNDFTIIKKEYEQIFSDKALNEILKYINNTKQKLQTLKVYPFVIDTLIAELENIQKKVTIQDRITILRSLCNIDNHFTQINLLIRLQNLMQEYTYKYNIIMKENESQRLRRFDHCQINNICTATRDITSRIASNIILLYESFLKTDKEVIENILHFNGHNNQQIKVLLLLLANPKVKRTLLPGMIGVLGNLNPVISRIYHSKIKENITSLKTYCDTNPYTLVYYIIKIAE